MTGESNGCPDYGAMHNFSSRHTSHPSVDHTTVDVPEDHKPTRSPADPQTPMSLLRKLSNKAEEEMAESSTFFCFVCCENMEESCRYQLEGCQNDSHTLCRDCTAGWIQSKITDGEVMRLPCPMMADASCAGFASEQDVTQLCSEDIIRRFERFQTLGGEEGAEYRQCPRCAVLNKGSLAFQALSGFKPLVKCSACEYEYCFFHSDAHPGSSCLSFAVAQRRTELIEAQDPNYVQESSRPCPKCAAPSYKYAGCNHMSCQECKRRFGEATEWCWLCSEDMGGLNNVTDHYGSGKCSGAQFAPERQWAAETGSQVASAAVARGLCCSRCRRMELLASLLMDTCANSGLRITLVHAVVCCYAAAMLLLLCGRCVRCYIGRGCSRAYPDMSLWVHIIPVLTGTRTPAVHYLHRWILLVCRGVGAAGSSSMYSYAAAIRTVALRSQICRWL